MKLKFMHSACKSLPRTTTRSPRTAMPAEARSVGSLGSGADLRSWLKTHRLSQFLETQVITQAGVLLRPGPLVHVAILKEGKNGEAPRAGNLGRGKSRLHPPQQEATFGIV